MIGCQMGVLRYRKKCVKFEAHEFVAHAKCLYVVKEVMVNLKLKMFFYVEVRYTSYREV